MTNPHQDRTGLDRVWHAIGHSIAGLRSAYRHEPSFRQESWAAALLVPLAFWIGRGWLEVVLLLGSLTLVLIVELLNSAVETTIDRVSLDWHELSGRAKDIASAAVLLSLLLCGAIWLSALWHRLAG